MKLAACHAQLSQHADVIRTLVTSVSEEQARWKPSPDEWSILEVINHLYDEERADFRTRLDLLLHDPEAEWPPIDPMGWVTERRYNERPLDDSLHSFLSERQRSLTWLDTLDSPNWDNSKTHPVAGTFHAGDMLAAWVAHDVLHMRQLVELKWALTEQTVRPFSPQYAGDW